MIKNYLNKFSLSALKNKPKALCGQSVLNLFFELGGISYRLPSLNTIVLSVNKSCNLSCLTCDVGQKNGTGLDCLRGKQVQEYMEVGLVRKIVNDRYVQRKKPDFSILMTEPLMHPEIGVIVRTLKNQGHFVKLSTNGLLLEQKSRELIFSNVDEIQVSLDGDKQTHDVLRRKEGLYETAIKGLRAVNDNRKIKLIVNFTVSNLNHDKIGGFLDALDSQGIQIDLCKIQFMYYVSEPMIKKQNSVSAVSQQIVTISDIISPEKVNPDILAGELGKIKSSYKNIKTINIIPFIRDSKQIKKFFNPQGSPLENNNKCYMPWHYLTINTDGKVFVHARCFNYEYGDVTKQGIGEIYHNEKISQFRKELADNKFCLPACSRCCGVMEFGHGPWQKSR